MNPRTPCILWEGALDSRKRYGRTSFEGRLVGAHQAAYCRHHGLSLADIKGLCVCHSCDTPACINGEHLFLGTQQENMDDAKSKGRMSSGDSHRRALASRDFEYDQEFCDKVSAAVRRGVAHPATSLTDTQVEEIRRLAVEGKVSQRRIARQFGISQATVSHIKTGATWAA